MSYGDRDDLFNYKNESKIKLEEITMKKDLIFAPIMLLVIILLALMKATGLQAHIGISVAGVLVLGVYTSLTKKNWKI